ncbi:MAG: PAS domain S-box protein [Geobacteraceae bacterium]|nr:PAS domain S-box protein [Geobacteraceae bacterium]
MTSHTGFQHRLRDYILKKHGSINAFCRASGIKYPAQMTPYLKGKCLPGKKMIERLEKDGADVEWILTGHSMGEMMTPISDALALSRYRMDIDNLLRQVRLHIGRFDERFKPAIEAYAVLDDAENIVDLNGSLERFLGYEPNRLSGVSMSQLIHPEDYAQIKSSLQRQTPDEAVLMFYSRFLAGNGSYVNVEWSLSVKKKPMSDLCEYAMILRKTDCKLD